MSDELEKEKTLQVALNLDADRRREIDGIKSRFEDFMRSQIEIRHAMEIVAEGQKSLKERFETGTARTLKELKDSFDQFRVEWGKKMAEDSARDEKILDAKNTAADAVAVASRAKDRVDGIIMKFAYTLFGSAALVALIWALSLILKR